MFRTRLISGIVLVLIALVVHHYRRAGVGCDAFYHIGDRSV